MFIFKFKPQSEVTSSETSMTNSNIMKQQHQQQHQLQQQAINNYWISNYQLSESEFDTTRLSCYLNALNLSRRNRSRNRTTGQQQQQNLVNNNNISNNKHTTSHHHIRSKSVDAPLNRLRMSLVHKPVVGSLITTLTSGAGAKIISSNNNNNNNNSGNNNSGNPNCPVLVTRSESLNSEGSSLGESGAGEFGSSAIHNPGKSALKKGSPNNQSDQHHQLSHQGKKNVTFSAYAMIQVMDG